MAGGTFGPLEMIIHDLPDAGQHNTRTVQIGPDDMMYISVGSTCNECAEPNPENATILRATLDGKTRSIFASGLRDTVGWGWHPKTGELWGMDNGMDGLGDNDPPEELNHIEKGKRYGWPYVYADNKPNPTSIRRAASRNPTKNGIAYLGRVRRRRAFPGCGRKWETCWCARTWHRGRKCEISSTGFCGVGRTTSATERG